MAPLNIQSARGEASKPLFRFQLPNMANKNRDDNIASMRNESNIATASDSGTDMSEYTPPGSDEHTSPKTKPSRPNEDTDTEIGIVAELSQLFGVGDTRPFVKVSRALASAYAADLEQTLHIIGNLIRDPLRQWYREVLHIHWERMYAVLLEVKKDCVVPLTYPNACAIDNRAMQPLYPCTVPVKLKRSTIKMLKKPVGPRTCGYPRLINGIYCTHPQSSFHCQEEKARDLMSILRKADLRDTHASRNLAAQTGKQSKPKWNTLKVQNVERAVDLRSLNIPLATAHSWIDGQSESKWNTVEVNKAARAVDLQSHSFPLGTAHSWIDGVMKGNSPKLSTLEQVRSQMADQVVDDGCTACANWGCDHCKPDWYDSLLHELAEQDTSDCNAGWGCTEHHAPDDELEHRVESKQIDKPEEGDEPEETDMPEKNGESELCDGSWGGCGECSNCTGGDEGYIDEEKYDGPWDNTMFGPAVYTKIEDEMVAAGAAPTSKAAQTGNTHASYPVSVPKYSYTALKNLSELLYQAYATTSKDGMITSSTKEPATATTVSNATRGNSTSHADAWAVRNQVAEVMVFTDGAFSVSEAEDFLRMCHGQPNTAKVMYDGSGAENVRQMLKTWLSTTGGPSAPAKASFDDVDSEEADCEVRAPDEEEISKMDDCRACSMGCDTCDPEQDSEDIIVECRHCDNVFSTSSVERCPECDRASGLHTYRDSDDKYGGSESKHSGLLGTLESGVEVSAADDRGPSLGHDTICEPEASGWSTDFSQVGPANDEGNEGNISDGPPTWECGMANESCRSNTDDGWGASSNHEVDLDDMSARGHSQVDGGNDGASITSKDAIPVPKPYTVTFWATVECGEDSMNIPIDSSNVSGPEKLILDGPAKKVWKWVQEKGLGDKIGLQDAFDLAKDMQEDDEPKHKPMVIGLGSYEHAPRHYTQPRDSRQPSVRSKSPSSLWGGGGDGCDFGNFY
jgi:hypothetical protein